MNLLHSLRNVFWRKDDLSEELESHLRMAAEDRIARGESPASARKEAMREFGNVPLIADVTRSKWGGLRLEENLQTLRFSLRQLRRSPGLTITAVITLALGIGALTTVATWTNSVLYNPWPHVDTPRELRFIDATVLGGSGYSMHYDQYRFLRQSSHFWKDAISFAQTSVNLAQSGTPSRAIIAGVVSSNFFEFLGFGPQSGRFFQSGNHDRAYGANDEIVLSDRLWRDAFHGDPEIVGRAISINRHPFTVIGVGPRNFAGIWGGIAQAAWIPLSSLRDLSTDAPLDPLLHYGLQVAVRLRSGVSDAAAAAELHALAHSFALQQPGSSGRFDWNLRDAAHFQRGIFILLGSQLPVLLGASVLLMMLVCINVASLLGQQAARRRREIAIRTALGASAGRIARQVLVETSMLALAGALAGWAASVGMARLLYVLLPRFGGTALAFNLHSDFRILLFVTAIAVAVTLACGIAPVRQSLRISQSEALHEGGATVAGGSRKRFGRGLVLGLQLGICFIVLVCCGLLTRTAFNIVNRTTGFDRANCLTASVALSRSGYDEQRGLALQTQLLNKLRSAPGVASATLTSHLPMGDDGAGNTQGIHIPGYVPAKGEDMEVVTDSEGSNFFEVMGIAVPHGRDFSAQDTASSIPVAIINEAMALRYWPKGNALGSTVIVDERSRNIIGIVSDYSYSDPADTDPSPLLFLPLAQNYSSDIFLAVRSKTTASAVMAQLRQVVSSLDSSLPLEDVRALEEVTGERYQLARIPAQLLGAYAISSVLVAMLGLYAVMAYAVTERHREFALRLALGSTRAGIFRLVLSGSVWTSVVGVVAGGIGSIAAVRLLRSMLFGVTPFDPASYCLAVVLLLITVFFSGVLPARRAASVQPMQALRTE